MTTVGVSRDAESLTFWAEFDFEFATLLIKMSEFDSEFATLLKKVSEFDSEFLRFLSSEFEFDSKFLCFLKSEFEFDSEFSKNCRVRFRVRQKLPSSIPSSPHIL